MKARDIICWALAALIFAGMVAYWIFGKPECPAGSEAQITGRGVWLCVAEPLP